jgi:hypothetical protein
MKQLINFKSYFLAFLLLITFNCSHAQSQSENDDNLVSKTELGKYQIQIVNSRLQPYIPGDIDEIVFNNRKENERVYISLSDIIRIMILSKQEISSADFKPIEQIAHVEE